MVEEEAEAEGIKTMEVEEEAPNNPLNSRCMPQSRINHMMMIMGITMRSTVMRVILITKGPCHLLNINNNHPLKNPSINIGQKIVKINNMSQNRIMLGRCTPLKKKKKRCRNTNKSNK